MVRNMTNAFLFHSDRRNMLVIVGKYHAPGMTEILLRDYGFQPVHLH